MIKNYILTPGLQHLKSTLQFILSVYHLSKKNCGLENEGHTGNRKVTCELNQKFRDDYLVS